MSVISRKLLLGIFLLLAVSLGGCGKTSDVGTVTDPGGGDQAPAVPTNLVGLASDGNVDLDWDDNIESDLDGYSVYRSTMSSGPYTEITAELLALSEFVDAAVVNGTTYYYAVSASDTLANESAKSAAINATPTDDINNGDLEEYYQSVDRSSGAALRVTLHEIIDDHRRIPYTSSSLDTWNVLEIADQDPNDSGRVLDVYRNQSYQKFGAGNNDYNREHTWPKSYGFPDDGSTNYPYTDCHHLFLCNDSYNSSRGNKPYGTAGGSGTERPTDANNGVGGGTGTYPGWSNWFSTTYWETWFDRRGDVARALFYMDVRYEGGTHGTTSVNEPDLILTDNLSLIQTTGSNASVAYMGLLSVLVEWHLADPVDEKETIRNDAVANSQLNRNPFIDHPEWVACIFGNDPCVPATP